MNPLRTRTAEQPEKNRFQPSRISTPPGKARRAAAGSRWRTLRDDNVQDGSPASACFWAWRHVADTDSPASWGVTLITDIRTGEGFLQTIILRPAPLPLRSGDNRSFTCTCVHTRAQACTHARTHARTRARTHTHTHTHTLQSVTGSSRAVVGPWGPGCNSVNCPSFPSNPPPFPHPFP